MENLLHERYRVKAVQPHYLIQQLLDISKINQMK